VHVNGPPRGRGVRGQAGLTLIELLLVIVVGTVVLIPLFGLVNQTLLRRSPTITANETASEFRLFRAMITRDWAEAAVVRMGAHTTPVGEPADQGRLDCNHGNWTGSNSITGARIAIVTSRTRTDPPGPVRIVYSTRHNANGSVDIVRRLCRHRQENSVPANPECVQPPVATKSSSARVCPWTFGTSVNPAQAPADVVGVDFPNGIAEDKVVIRNIQSLDIPSSELCNVDPSPPFDEVCDVNITVKGRDGQSLTVRLRQQTGRDT
jgi:hypothetical protein